MFNQIKVQVNEDPPNMERIALLSVTLILVSLLTIPHEQIIQKSRESVVRSLRPNATEGEIHVTCNISYDDSRCSRQSANFNKTQDCLSDFEAMVGHILPLVSFVMQICLIQDLFVITRKYSFILVNILSLVALFIFIIIAIAVHDGTCYNFYATYAVTVSGQCLGAYVLYLFVQSREKYPFPEEIHLIDENIALSTFDDDSEIWKQIL